MAAVVAWGGGGGRGGGRGWGGVWLAWWRLGLGRWLGLAWWLGLGRPGLRVCFSAVLFSSALLLPASCILSATGILPVRLSVRISPLRLRRTNIQPATLWPAGLQRCETAGSQ